ncbi:hypothetical protein A0H81_08571 [Grifola frondosa]|uniref:Extracellular serine-rich protein n=1 Tax=Grifola frondosa TaxID=5627 RepID=A0A1C7M313_GRIFR|nr:hypothetical protein A0H81_08571 [Grifola frondosa]
MRFVLPLFSSLVFFTALVATNDVIINVGNHGLLFTPSSVQADVGTNVVFIFNGAPSNHSVSQSSFDRPCEQLVDGFDSGYIVVTSNTTSDFPTWELTITDSEPIWFYCAQEGPPVHCISGMVGSINPGSGQFDSFQAAARSASTVFPASLALSGVGATASSPPGPLTGSISSYDVHTGFSVISRPTAPSSPTSTSPPSISTGHGWTTNASNPSSSSGIAVPSGVAHSNRELGVVVGSAVGGLVGFISLLLIVGFMWRSRTQRRSRVTTYGVDPFLTNSSDGLGPIHSSAMRTSSLDTVLDIEALSTDAAAGSDSKSISPTNPFSSSSGVAGDEMWPSVTAVPGAPSVISKSRQPLKSVSIIPPFPRNPSILYTLLLGSPPPPSPCPLTGLYQRTHHYCALSGRIRHTLRPPAHLARVLQTRTSPAPAFGEEFDGEYGNVVYIVGMQEDTIGSIGNYVR